MWAGISGLVRVDVDVDARPATKSVNETDPVTPDALPSVWSWMTRLGAGPAGRGAISNDDAGDDGGDREDEDQQAAGPGR